MVNVSEYKHFGPRNEEVMKRASVYAVMQNKEHKFLLLNVYDWYHLPGGGIEEGEDEIKALEREVAEETGYDVYDFSSIGKASQYYVHGKLGPMTKYGTFYTATFRKSVIKRPSEEDHVVEWLSWEAIQQTNLADFQKWAIKQAIRQR